MCPRYWVEFCSGRRSLAEAQPLVVEGYEGLRSHQAEIPRLFAPALCFRSGRSHSQAVRCLAQEETARWRAKLADAGSSTSGHGPHLRSMGARRAVGGGRASRSSIIVLRTSLAERRVRQNCLADISRGKAVTFWSRRGISTVERDRFRFGTWSLHSAADPDQCS